MRTKIALQSKLQDIIQKNLEEAKAQQEGQAQTLNTEESQQINDQENDQNLANLIIEESKEIQIGVKEEKEQSSLQQFSANLELPD